jgi:ABC-2 type transport system ATP-binding protein
MLPDGSIHAEHIWKRFRADRRGVLLRYELRRAYAKLRGDSSRFWRWALRDVDLIVTPGESVGLVGANGSGKTTLLKILSRVMLPYAGRIDVTGRVGALIEIRAGIHPDLTGRENIYLFGSLLGLPRRLVTKRFDDIVGFAGLEEAIDRQTKYFSSGMQMRLGFAVAAFLEPDVLLVDEILAVGDASFQQRCLERMREVLAQGTTVVYVSHDLASVEATCSRGVWLSEGRVRADGPVREVLSAYRRSVEEAAAFDSPDSLVARVIGVDASTPDGDIPRTQGPLEISIRLQGLERSAELLHNLYIGVSEGTATPIFVLRHDVRIGSDPVEIRCSIPRLPLPKGSYYVWMGIFGHRGRDLLAWHPVSRFDVAGDTLEEAPRAIVRLAPIHVEAAWDVERNGSNGPGIAALSSLHAREES